MATIFTKIIEGEIPGEIVHADERCVAFMDIQPQTRGHVLVVPRAEVDHWVDLPDNLRDHLFAVAQRIGKATYEAFGATRSGLVIAGYGVPHTHLHVIPIRGGDDLDPANAAPIPAEELAKDAAIVRECLARA